MKTLPITKSILEQLAAIAEDYLEGEYVQESNRKYFEGKRDAYKLLLETYSASSQ